jgi:hypothetical protein
MVIIWLWKEIIKMIVPMPMPIYSNGGGGDISLQALIIFVLRSIYIIQLALCIVELFFDEYEDKKEFFFELIPFIPWIVKLVKKIIEL